MGTSCLIVVKGHRCPQFLGRTMAAQGAWSTPGSREARVQPSPGQAGCRPWPTHPAGLMAPPTLSQPPQWARLQPAPLAGTGSPRIHRRLWATRPRPLASQGGLGTAVVVPAALSLPGYHTTTVAQGSPSAAVALRREATSQQQRPGGEATKRSLAWDPPSLSRLPKNRERREVPGC